MTTYDLEGMAGRVRDAQTYDDWKIAISVLTDTLRTIAYDGTIRIQRLNTTGRHDEAEAVAEGIAFDLMTILDTYRAADTRA